jgi:peptidyl-prolyl cis-trans isomerase A (cyclophilin A)
MLRMLLIAIGVGACAIAIILGLQTRKKPEPAIVVPQIYRVKFETTQGGFVVEVKREWAPRGADRFYRLIKMGYYTESRFYRVLPGFIAQFGVHRDFNIHDKWRKYFIIDDPMVEKNTRGTLSFAKSDPNTRATEVFINLKDNAALDEQSFVPFAKIVEGMDVPDKLYSGYGEMRPEGKYIDAGRVEEEANEYLEPRFPKLDYIKTATLVQ